MARSKAGDKMVQQVMRTRRSNRQFTGPVQGSAGVVIDPNVASSTPYDFLDYQHPVYSAWIERWLRNEARLAGGDDVVDELRPFEWETDTSETGFYAKRKQDAVYTNFPDIFATSITGHLLRFAPKPDQGWSVPNMGKVTGKSKTPTQAEQIWYSTDNPSGAGSEWNQFWAGACKRAMATGHRWMYVESTVEAAGTRAREQQGFRPYAVEYSPIDTPNWFINERDILEYVVFKTVNEGLQFFDGKVQQSVINRKGYLLLVRAGCQRLGPRFVEGGWWMFTPDKVLLPDTLGHDTWVDTSGEIPVSVLYYERHKGTSDRPAISRPGITELGQAAVAAMNLGSAANYNVWEAGGGVDYLLGIDDDAYLESERLQRAGSRRIPIPPNSETDGIPQVFTSAMGAVPAENFKVREEAVWNAAVRIGIIEAAGQVGGTGNGSSGATAEMTFAAAQGPRIVWFATNLSACQNNILRYFELRYGHKQPTGQVNWTSKFDLATVVDRIRSFFEIERLSGIRSGTAGATAMVMAAEDKGLVIDPAMKATMLAEYTQSSKTVNKIQALAANPTAAGVVGKPQKFGTAKKQSDRLAVNSATGTRGKPGTNGGRGPKQKPTTPAAPGSKK